MSDENVDAFVAFERVRVVTTTPGALRCAIGDKRVWLPREHIRGRLWCRGDSGTLLVRRWVALDRHLAIEDGPRALRLACRSVPASLSSRRLHLLPPGRSLGH
jgi:hypothetical protein